MVNGVQGPPPKTTQDRNKQSSRPYITWDNALLEENSTAEPGLDPGPFDQWGTTLQLSQAAGI